MKKSLDSKEVAYLPLGEVGTFTRGNSGLQKKDFTESGIGCIHYGQIYTYYGTFADETKSFVSESLFEKSRKAKKGNLIIADTSENDDDLCKAVAWLGNEEIAISNHTFIYTHSLNPKYVSYFLQTDMFHKQKRPFITGTKVRSISAGNMAKIQIPIPYPDNPEKSLEEQSRIVTILDKFDALTAELTTALTTEIELRKKQYNYYRDQLLSFEEWRALSEVAEYSKVRIGFDKLNEDNYVGVENLLQNRLGKTKSTRVPEKGNFTQYGYLDILIGNIRPYLKKIWHADRIGGTNGDVLVVHITDKAVSPRYLYHVLADDNFFEYNMQHAKGAKMPRGNKVRIMEYPVPIPCPDNPEKSLEEQSRIVTILDKFDTLTNSISEGLPREIELRQKQYNYYRDKLLSFEKGDV